MIEALCQLMQRGTPIQCDELAMGVGYPGPYTVAERALGEAGWRYFISHDTWYPPGERPSHA